MSPCAKKKWYSNGTCSYTDNSCEINTVMAFGSPFPWTWLVRAQRTCWPQDNQNLQQPWKLIRCKWRNQSSIEQVIWWSLDLLFQMDSNAEKVITAGNNHALFSTSFYIATWPWKDQGDLWDQDLSHEKWTANTVPTHREIHASLWQTWHWIDDFFFFLYSRDMQNTRPGANVMFPQAYVCHSHS